MTTRTAPRARGGLRTVSAGGVDRAGLHAGLTRTALQRSHTDDGDPRRQYGFVAMTCGPSLHAVQLGKPTPHSLFYGRPGPGSCRRPRRNRRRCGFVAMSCGSSLHAIQLPPPPRTHCSQVSPGPARVAALVAIVVAGCCVGVKHTCTPAPLTRIASLTVLRSARARLVSTYSS
jgi:hypothetical protein